MNFWEYVFKNPQLLFLMGMIVVLIILMMVSTLSSGSLDKVKLKRAGNGQFGTARWSTKKEDSKYFKTVQFDPRKWREIGADREKALKEFRDKVGDTSNMTEEEKEKIHKQEVKIYREHSKGLPTKPGIILGGWHRGGHIANDDLPHYIDKKGRYTGGKVFVNVETHDVHCLMTSSSGGGKTSFFLMPQLEYNAACGISMLITDTKGDIYHDFGGIAKEKYGYNVIHIDTGHPLASGCYNIMHMVNKYSDLYKACEDKNSPEATEYKAKMENYAKIVARTIIMQGSGDGNFGSNSFFYDSAQGILGAYIMAVSLYCPDNERHIISVYKLVQQTAGTAENGDTKVKEFLDNLPKESKINMLAGAAANGAGDSQSDVMSTAMSKLLNFIDSETEQILCFKSDIDAEEFCKNKTLIIFDLAEEHPERYFIASLAIQELYQELLTLSRDNLARPNKVPAHDWYMGNPRDYCVRFFLDEFGTLPPIASADKMFSAARSRNVLLVPIIQGTIQLENNYGKAAKIITDNCQDTIFGGLAPNSGDADVFSKRLGFYTVQSGSVSKSHKENAMSQSSSDSLSLIKRELMTPDEIRTMPQGDWIVMISKRHPSKVHIDLYIDWGMTNECPLALNKHRARRVPYAEKDKLVQAIKEAGDDADANDYAKSYENILDRVGDNIAQHQNNSDVNDFSDSDNDDELFGVQASAPDDDFDNYRSNSDVSGMLDSGLKSINEYDSKVFHQKTPINAEPEMLSDEDVDEDIGYNNMQDTENIDDENSNVSNSDSEFSGLYDNESENTDDNEDEPISMPNDEGGMKSLDIDDSDDENGDMSNLPDEDEDYDDVQDEVFNNNTPSEPEPSYQTNSDETNIADESVIPDNDYDEDEEEDDLGFDASEAEPVSNPVTSQTNNKSLTADTENNNNVVTQVKSVKEFDDSDDEVDEGTQMLDDELEDLKKWL